MFLSWKSAGNKTITITGLKDQDYTFYLFDWIRGDLLSTQEVVAENGRLTLNEVPTRDGRLAGYIARKPASPPLLSPRSMIRLVFRDMNTQKESMIELEANHSYELNTSVIETTVPPPDSENN